MWKTNIKYQELKKKKLTKSTSVEIWVLNFSVNTCYIDTSLLNSKRSDLYANLISNHVILEKHLSLTSFYTIFLVCFDLSSVSQTLSLPPTDLLSLCWKSQLKSTYFVLISCHVKLEVRGAEMFCEKISWKRRRGRLLLFNKIQISKNESDLRYRIWKEFKKWCAFTAKWRLMKTI